MILSPERRPGIYDSTPVRCIFRSSVEALEIDSQNVIFPLLGITTTSPGSDEDADAETRDPSGSGPSSRLDGSGKGNSKASGDGMFAV